jgi:Protein of unknown function (DUF3584)
MTSRLRKIFLINARNSGRNCSGRITEIDPRGGAAITGPNGVGKTTTLQLLPLFFGHSPSQLAPTGENRESLLKFALPQPESAIAFEYQRGDEATDVCLVVLRRQSQTDAAEYRFFEGGFNEAYFVTHSSARDDASFFLDDVASVDAATKLGCAPTGKFTSPEYRNTILNTIGVGKSADTRRSAARMFSFSKKRLPYLDRLVAAVVKERILFTDFTDVAATIVTERMGGMGKSANGKYPQLRQSKEQIERWLKDRDGAERAIKLNPIIDALRVALGENQQNEIVLGHRRADVRALIRINERIQSEKSASLTEIGEQRSEAVQIFNGNTERLEKVLEEARKREATDANELLRLKLQKEHLEDNDAANWAMQDTKLPLLKVEKGNTENLMNALQQQASGIASSYESQIEKIRTEAAETSVKINERKGPILTLYDEEISLLREQETNALTSLSKALKAQETTLSTDLNAWIDTAAEARQRLKSPTVAPEIEEAIENASNLWAKHQEEHIEQQKLQQSLLQQVTAADKRWIQLESAITQQKQRLITTDKALQEARARAMPIEGSLHATLLETHGEVWRETIARIIDPALLQRTDLHAQLVDEGSTAYGWALNLEAIEAPSWIQKGVLDKDVEDCSYTDETARRRLTELEVDFEKASAERERANQALALQDAVVNVIVGKTTSLKADLQGRRDVKSAALKTAQADAERKHKTAQEKLIAARAEFSRFETERDRKIEAEKKSFTEARTQALNRRNTKLDGIDEEIKKFQKAQKVAIKVLEDERDSALTNAGVDTTKLSRLRAELEKLDETIREIQSHSALVREWNEWITTQGQSRFVDADVTHTRAAEQTTFAQADLDALNHTHKALLQEIGRQENALRAAASAATQELEALESLDKLLLEFPASGHSSLTGDTLAYELKGTCKALIEQLERNRRDIGSKLQRIERELCELECSTKDFVNGVMGEGEYEESEIARAGKMVRLYDRIPREVVVNVNNSLSTILGNISEYRKTILRFESEVKRFNNELQEGLKKVSQNFERFSDFTASVITDFEKIDFISKLKLLDDIVIEHRAQHHVSYSADVPPAHTAAALRTFMTALSSGSMEINLGKHITLSGSVTDDGNFKTFHNETQLEQLSSNGLTAIALTSLLCGLLNVIRGTETIFVPWATDEVGRFDADNFRKLMDMLKDNHIDPVTASPALTPAAFRNFAKRYVFGNRGVIAEYAPRERSFPTDAALSTGAVA